MHIIPVAHAYDLSKDFGFGNIGSVPDLIGKLMGPAFMIAATVVMFYFLIGAVKFISSGGDKNAIAEARDMIVHAIVGLFLLLMMWLVLRYIPEFFGLKIGLFK